MITATIIGWKDNRWQRSTRVRFGDVDDLNKEIAIVEARGFNLIEVWTKPIVVSQQTKKITFVKEEDLNGTIQSR